MRKVFLDDLPRIIAGRGIDWKQSVGHCINFIYDNIEGKFDIIEYDKYKQYLTIIYKEKEYIINTGDFVKCKFAKILGFYTSIFRYHIGEIIITKTGKQIQIIDQFKKNNGNVNKKFYKYKCLFCMHEHEAVEYSIERGVGCPYCCSNPLKVSTETNMWTINPDLAKLLADPKDGYKYTQNCHTRVDWKCPICGNIIKNRKIQDINTRGLSCPKCSDGISYPEKFITSLLIQLKLNFITQLNKSTYKWCEEYRYDFYFEYNNKSYIIETHGAQHYENKPRHNKRNLIEEQNIDKNKQILAFKNNIDYYIILDCRNSNLEWIKNSIMLSDLTEIFNINKSNIDWYKCHNFACNSYVKDVANYWNLGIVNTQKIAAIMKLNRSTIIKYLKQATKCELCNYDTKEGREKRIKEFGKKISKAHNKSVICLNTNIIYKSITEASYHTGINKTRIGVCCRNKGNFAGNNIDTNELLHWMFYNDYILKTDIEIEKKINEMNNKNNPLPKNIICLNTNIIYKSISEASKLTNILSSSICECCKGKLKSAGKHSETQEPLHWMYLSDYNNFQDNQIVS